MKKNTKNLITFNGYLHFVRSMKKILIICLVLMFCLSGLVIVNPVESENTKSSAQRVVLAELFTSTSCDYCSHAEKAVEDLADEYGPSKLAVLEYHAGGEFYTEDSSNRAKYYFGPTGTGTPDMIFDGVIEEEGANPSERDDDNYEKSCYDAYKSDVDERLDVPSSFEITPSPSVAGNIGTITAYIKAVSNPEKSNLKVRFVVFEDNVYYTEGDGGPYYQFVVRDVLGEESLSFSKAGESTAFTKTFSISSNWDKKELGIAVFIQTDENAGRTGLTYKVDDEVLQASICKFGVSLTSDETSKDVGSGGTATFDIDMKNMMSATETFDIYLEKNLPSDWDASYTACTSSVCLPGQNQSEITLSSDETGVVHVNVISSAGSKPNDSGSVTLTVTSQTNPYVKSSVVLKITTLPGPTQPTITFESASETSISISWTKNTDSNFNRYEIHMSTSSGFTSSNTTLVKTLTNQNTTTNQNTISWEVTGLTEDTEYYFKLRVYDTNDQYSDSDEINAKTLKTETEGGGGGIPGFDVFTIIIALCIILIFRKRFLNEN